MKRKVIAMVTLLSTVILGGCSLLEVSGADKGELVDELQQLREKGIIACEESTLGVPLTTEDITDVLTNGQYYVLHDNVLYPCYTQETSYSQDSTVTAPDPVYRYNMVSSETVINIPTLFEGDKLYYYSEEGVLDYTQFERYKDLGWSIGIDHLSLTKGGYAFVNLEDEQNAVFLHNSLTNVRNYTDATLLVDTIGGVRITEDFVENGIITGLTEGVTYDLALYNGTNYIYCSANVDTRYFQSMEMYATATYYPLQDYLYEIEVPDYLLNGYYNVGNTGLMRLVRGTQYDETTDFNEVLLVQYASHEEGNDTLKGTIIPFRYSEVPALNEYRAWDETCFGYVDPNQPEEEVEEEKNELALANFVAASKTQTTLWLPAGRQCTIEIVSSEITGSILLRMNDGHMKEVPYDRIRGSYQLVIDGKGEIVDLIVQGLYHDYKIVLTNAESYRGQDTEVVPEEVPQEKTE